MNLYINVIILILAFSPIIDIIYTILYRFIGINLPIQQLIRAAIFAFLFLNIKRKKHKWVVLSLAILLAIGQVYIIINKYPFSLLNNFSFLIKILSLFCILFYVKEKLVEKQITIKEIIGAFNISASILSINIIISNIFKIGLQTYNYGNRYGYKGFIEAHNDVTVVLLMLFPLLVYFYIKEKSKYSLINTIITAISLILIGPKAGKLLLLMEVVIFGIYYIVKNVNTLARVKNIKLINYNRRIINSIGILLTIMLCLVIYTNFNQVSNNIKNYVINKGYRSIYSYVVSYRDIQTVLIDNLIESQYNIHPKYQFGMGYYYTNKVLHEQKEDFYMIENDIDGLIYYTGILTASIILFILLVITFRIVSIKNINKELMFFIVTSVIISYIHSFLGGHVLYSALANTYLGTILGIGYFISDKKDINTGFK